MKTKFFTLSMIAILAITSISCSKSDPNPAPSVIQNPIATNKFTATIGTENFSNNDVKLITISAGGTQGFYMTPVNGKSFSSAIFAENFPIGEARPIAYSGYISYKLNDVIYIPKSGTITLSIMEPYTRMKGTFTGVFVGGTGTSDITISGEFDISK
jgi:hypothetical protein